MNPLALYLLFAKRIRKGPQQTIKKGKTLPDIFRPVKVRDFKAPTTPRTVENYRSRPTTGLDRKIDLTRKFR